MHSIHHAVLASLFAALVAAPGQALAQNTPPAAVAPLPPPTSDNDPQPRVSGPTTPSAGLIQQAGVGGETAFGRAGVLELGGSAAFAVAGELLTLRIAPSIGWFFMNNVELSGIVSLNVAQTTNNGVSNFSSSLNILVEPSAHLPLSRVVFLFAGVGVGLSYADGPGAGFALAPRLGADILIGRSGVFKPALTLVYSTSGVIETSQGTLLTASTSFGLNLGYTVMW